MPPPAKTRTRPKPKRDLILSGGGARGAYQVGVWKHLQEMGWEPDLICGTSVGAINATALGCDMQLDELINLWKTIERGRVYRISFWKQLLYFFTRRGFQPLMDTGPQKDFLTEQFDVRALRQSKYEIIITAVNILTSQLKFFNNDVIDIEHVMASSAIPILFPWQYIDGEPYWDGGIMANTPILPALERGVKEIIVVLLSPVGGESVPPPRTRGEAVEDIFEQSQIGSYKAFRAHLNWDRKVRAERGLLGNLMPRRGFALGDVKIAAVAPERMLGFHSMMNFSRKQAHILIPEGYRDAKHQLAEFFGNSPEPY